MKKTMLVMLAVVATVVGVQAQETLFKADSGSGPKVFVAPLLELSKQNNLAGISAGLGAGVMAGNFYAGVYYLDNNETGANPGSYDQRFRHGGLWAGYILNPDKLIHYQAGLKLGYGALINYLNTDNISSYRGNLLVANPNIGAEANITSFMKFGLNAGYRFTSAVGIESTDYLDVKDYQGVTVEAVIKIGNF
ncbi:MAG: hypothetical protein ACNS60_07560 [Candidatus Cyclobacteriaceae bacterium M2_1C_046]